MTCKLVKSSKLLKRAEYKRLCRCSVSVAGKYVTIDCFRSGFSKPRLGITVTKKFGKAHERNRFKRIVREAFRLVQRQLPVNLDMNVRPRALAKEATSYLVLQEILTLLQRDSL